MLIDEIINTNENNIDTDIVTDESDTKKLSDRETEDLNEVYAQGAGQII